MEEFRQILRDAIKNLERPIKKTDNKHFQAFDAAYNLALNDVISMVINKIPN